MAEELIPIFHVKDGYETANWYARLGFEVESEHRFAKGMPLYLFLSTKGTPDLERLFTCMSTTLTKSLKSLELESILNHGVER